MWQPGAAASARRELCHAAWAMCLTRCSYEHGRHLAWLSSHSQRLLLSLFLPPFYLHPGLATYVPGNSFQGRLFPYTLLEIMANDLNTYWDFADFLRSTVSEQKEVFVFSCPTQAGLQPQEVLAGGLWLSGTTRLLPVGSAPFSKWLCSFSSLIPVSCSS